MKRVLEKICIIFVCSLSIFSIAQSSKPMRGCALPGPSSTCTKMESNGDLTLSWTKPTDPNNIFVRYEVYRLGTNGAIVSIPTFTNNNSTTINSFFANSEFYVGIVSLCGGTEVINYGDTVKTIDLKLSNQMDGRASLEWSTPSTRNTRYFQVEREHPKFGWSERDSVKNSLYSYIDTIDVCSALLNYRISIKQEGCISYSNSIGD